MVWNIPNILTVLRIVLIPVFVLVFFSPYSWANIASTAIFGLAALTDWLDGYLARRLKQLSVFGAFLDPVADKLMVAVALVLLVQDNPTVTFAIPAAIIIGREIAISALREWMSEIGERTKVKVSVIGKVVTTSQMITVGRDRDVRYQDERHPAAALQVTDRPVPDPRRRHDPDIRGRHPDPVVHVRIYARRLAGDHGKQQLK